LATYTTNYNLHKIDLTDAPPDITVLNGNWDIIDAKLHEAQGGGSKSTVVEDTLAANKWGTNLYTWQNANITSANQIIELLPSNTITAEQLEVLQMANIVGNQQSVGSVTFKAYGDIPTIDIPVIFVIRGDV
jgi:hypothetical protein